MPIVLPYCAEYTTKRDFCKTCRKIIAKDTIQIGIMIQSMTADCMQPEWHHMKCFFEIRRPVSVDLIDGFVNLRYNHQMEIRSNLGSTIIDYNANIGNDELEKEIKRQNQDFSAIYDQLKCLNDEHFMTILTTNNQFVPDRPIEILNHLTDIICFGALAPCSVCKHGKFVLKGSIYCCNGYDSPWSSCNNSIKEPERVPVFLTKKYQEMLIADFKVQTRILRDTIQFDENDFELHAKQPLFNMEFFIVGDTEKPRNVIESKIQAMGGKMASRIHANVTAVISSADEVKYDSIMIREAIIQRIQVIPDDFLNKVMDNDPIEVIVKNDLTIWGKDPYERMPARKLAIDLNVAPKSKSFSFDPNAVEGKVEVKIHSSDGIRYEAILNFVDIKSNKNTYVKLQLQENPKYTLTVSTGRIGTSVDKTISRLFQSLHSGKEEFKKIYLEKTGNVFGTDNFEKKPGLYNHVKICNDVLKLKVNRHTKMNAPPTKLNKQLYELMELLYSDDNVFHSALISFCFDLDSMPLGKLNITQIQDAISLLVEISTHQSTANINQIIAASNQFYSYFPQNFGFFRPPVIDTYKMVQEKMGMLQHLKQKELNYEKLISPMNKEKNLLDLCYAKLQESAEITMLNKSSGTYKQICDYVQNTQLKESKSFVLSEVFEVVRHEELMRYEPHETNYNRQLLFHGTRHCNLVGILTNGLKISPPEAIFRGSVFGKGIYFSDSVSKSAAYCDSQKGYGIVLLCEVAVGIVDSRYFQDKSDLANPCESVQALGQYSPDQLFIRPDGLKIPNGKLIRCRQNSGITFNEFVVSDVSRVKIRYIVLLKFNNQLR